MTTLYHWYQPQMALNQSFTDYAKTSPDPSVVLLYGFLECRFARLYPDGKLFNEEDKPVNLSSYYEIRAFNDHAELRWINRDHQGSGEAVILAERDLKLANWGTPRTDSVIETIPQSYLLWGQGTGKPSTTGWGRMAKNQIGSFMVPHPIVDQEYYALNAIEYIQVYQDGNAAVFEERLVGLKGVSS